MLRRLCFLTVLVAAHAFCLSSSGQTDPELLKRAAAGDATAMHLIGRAAAAAGQPVEAYAWFSLASENGIQTSERTALSNSLNSAQLAVAAERVVEIKGRLQRVAEIRSTILDAPQGPAASPAAQPQASPPAVPTNVSPPDLGRQLEAQRTRIAKLEADLAAARSEARDAKGQADEWTNSLETALEQANNERDALAAQVAALRQEKQLAEESAARLRAQPAQDGQAEARMAQITKLEKDLAAAQAEIRSAREEAGNATARQEAALEKAAQERDALSADLAELRREKQRIEESLSQLRARPSLDGQVESQRAQIAKLEVDLTAARSEAGAIRKQFDEATSRHEAVLARAVEERDSLSTEIATLRADKQRAEELVARLQAQPDMNGQVQSQKTQIAKLEADLAAARAETRAVKVGSGETTTLLEAALAKANQQQSASAAEIVALKTDKQRTEESLAQLRAKPALDGLVEAQKTQIAKLEADLAAARTETRNARSQSGESVAQIEAAMAKATQERDALTKDNTALRQDRTRAEEARDQMRVELSTARAKFESDLASARAETRAASQQSVEETSRLEAALAKANQQQAVLTAEVAALKADKQRAEEALAQMRAKPALDGQVESQRLQIAKLESELAAAQAATRAATGDASRNSARSESLLAEVTKERDALSREIASLRSDKQRTEESLAQLRARPSLDGQVAAQSSQIAQLEADLAAAMSEIQKYDSSIQSGSLVDATSLREELRQSELKVDMTTRAFARIEEDNARLQARVRELDARLAEVQLAAGNESSEVRQLRGELETANQARIAALESREVAMRDLTAAQIRNDNLVRELARARPGMLLASNNAPRAVPAVVSSPAPEPVSVPPPVATGERVHTVAEGESLSIISLRYYRNANRWPEIFNANRDVMRNENHLVPGMRLRIP